MTIASDYNFIKNIKIPLPSELAKELPITSLERTKILQARHDIANILSGNDKRMLIVVGPCSVHHPEPILQYAIELNKLRIKYEKRLFIVMRCYVEKSRTGNAWSGFALDPDINASFDCYKGIYESRKLMKEISMMGIPIGMEFVFPNISRYFLDFLSWGCIGARSVEAPDLRFFASGVSMPIGVKNSTSGNIEVAFSAMQVISNPQLCYLGNNVGITSGNTAVHLIYRGSHHNKQGFSLKKIVSFVDRQNRYGFQTKTMIDCSHGNAFASGGQDMALKLLINNMSVLRKHISGIMFESFIENGHTSFSLCNAKRACSITDSCLGIEETKYLLSQIYNVL